MGKLVVACSPLTNTIFAGKIIKDGRFGANKIDVTDMAVSAVAQHLLKAEQMLEFEHENKSYQLKVVVKK